MTNCRCDPWSRCVTRKRRKLKLIASNLQYFTFILPQHTLQSALTQPYMFFVTAGLNITVLSGYSRIGDAFYRQKIG